MAMEEEKNIMDSWKPKTETGIKVKAGEVTDIKDVLASNKPILEEQVVDILLPQLKSDLLLVGQAKGKFGGGKRRAFRQTQKKTKEGNRLSFSAYAVVGNGDGCVGVGIGKSKETIPAREKAIRNAKLNLMQVRRGKLSWEAAEAGPHTIPYAVTGKCGSSILTLIPAPLGTGLVVEKECQKLLKLAGIRDIWAQTRGQTKIKTNLIKACIFALKELNRTKVLPEHTAKLGIVDGPTGTLIDDKEFEEQMKKGGRSEKNKNGRKY